MVGSDKESIKSREQDSTKHQEEMLKRQESCSPPPKPPRIYDTAEGSQSPQKEVQQVLKNLYFNVSHYRMFMTLLMKKLKRLKEQS